MSLEFDLDVDVDEHGVFDGRQLAEKLIQAAFCVLVPYVHGCPACADALFSKIANDVIEELHTEGRKSGRLPSAIYAVGSDTERAENERRHLMAASASTAKMLREQLGGQKNCDHCDEESS